MQITHTLVSEGWEDILLDAGAFLRIKNKYRIKKGGALLSGFREEKRQSMSHARERISSCLSCGTAASMTVEACFVLPFFLFAFLNIISILELYRLQGNMSAAMHETEKQMAVYGYEYREVRGQAAGAAESLGLTYLYASNQVTNTLGAGYLDSSPIAGGASAISWVRSEVMREDDCIDLVAEYRVRPPVAVVGYSEFVMYNRLRTRAWTGYDNAGAGGSCGEEEIVYITPEGEVYHRSRSCTYLKLSITAVDKSILADERNADGAKYYPCDECGADCGNTVYITDYGNRYHASLSCSKLKRTVQAVPISQAGGRAPCSKCGH